MNDNIYIYQPQLVRNRRISEPSTDRMNAYILLFFNEGVFRPSVWIESSNLDPTYILCFLSALQVLTRVGEGTESICRWVWGKITWNLSTVVVSNIVLFSSLPAKIDPIWRAYYICQMGWKLKPPTGSWIEQRINVQTPWLVAVIYRILLPS